MSTYFYGSICLDDIPKEVIKQVTLRSGKVKRYVNIKVFRLRDREVETRGGFTPTHKITCQPKVSKRKEGVRYDIGELRECELGVYTPAPIIEDSDNGREADSRDKGTKSPFTIEDLPF